MRSVIARSPRLGCSSLSRRRQMSSPQWPTFELWTLFNRSETSIGSTIIGTSATKPCSTNVGGGGMLFTHNLDRASGTNWCSSLPGTWYRSKSLSWRYNFHRKTLPVNVTLMYVRFLWSVFKMEYLLSNKSVAPTERVWCKTVLNGLS